ncbi:MAG: hypothetical protein P8016_15055, partial [Sedimentisphaerales bacterium]
VSTFSNFHTFGEMLAPHNAGCDNSTGHVVVIAIHMTPFFTDNNVYYHSLIRIATISGLRHSDFSWAVSSGNRTRRG